jgi:RES domain-containing protein
VSASPSATLFGVGAALLSPLHDPIFYRSVSLPVIANLGVHPLDGAHAGRLGGRYNSEHSEPICYLAGTQTLAAFECEHEALILGLPGTPREPRVSFAVSVTNAQILDLTNAMNRQTVGVQEADLVQPTPHWRHLNRNGLMSPAQQLGAAVRARPDIDGLLVPSWPGTFIPSGVLPRLHNLVLFMDPANPRAPRRARAGVSVMIHDPTNLLP